jgi:hypothetical protein
VVILRLINSCARTLEIPNSLESSFCRETFGEAKLRIECEGIYIFSGWLMPKSSKAAAKAILTPLIKASLAQVKALS